MWLVENISHLENYCFSFEMKNCNRRINHVWDNTSWHRRYGNFQRFLHSIRRKNENLRAKEADISILFVSASLALILWQRAAATGRIHLKICSTRSFVHVSYFLALSLNLNSCVCRRTKSGSVWIKFLGFKDLHRVQRRFNGKLANACMCENTVNNISWYFFCVICRYIEISRKTGLMLKTEFSRQHFPC